MHIKYYTNEILLATVCMLIACAAALANAETVVVAENTLAIGRQSETIEIPWTETGYALVKENGKFISCQVVEGKMLFQSDFAAGEKKQFTVEAVSLPDGSMMSMPVFPDRTFGRYVPERMDDYAWENDRIAFRVYGPTLSEKAPKGEGLVSSSVDVWVKRTRDLVINKWYKSKKYHIDHGEGLDNYKCGTSRGCGGIGVWTGSALLNSGNWATQKTIAKGPIRTVAEFTYAAWDCGKGVKIRETRRISLDAGSNLNRFESVFTIEGADSAQIAVGLDISKAHRHEGLLEGGASKGWFANWEAEQKSNGVIGTAILLPAAEVTEARADGHALLIAKAMSGKPFVWYAGAGWSKSGDFADAAAWNVYIESATQRVRTPLKITIGK